MKLNAKTAIYTEMGKMITKLDEEVYSCSIEKKLEVKANNKMIKTKFQCERSKTATMARKLDEDKAKVVYNVNTSGGRESVEIVHAFTSYKPDLLPNLMEW